MATRYVKLREVRLRLDIDDGLLQSLTDEGLVEITAAGGEPVVTEEDAERLRVIAILVREMDINLPGVEVILHMREELVSTRRQFDEILRSLVEELRKRVGSAG